MRLLHRVFGWNRPQKAHPVRLCVETLEARALLASFSPAQIRHAYGFDRVAFGDALHGVIPGDGSGTVIAIVDAYDDPNIVNDLAQFNATYGLPSPPSFTKVNQTGGTVFPPANRAWAREIALDVEYAHAMAPGADILLVEADDNTNSNLFAAVSYAAAQPGVVAVSMSWTGDEYSGESFDDGHFLTPFGHAGVTFLASSGDNGASPQYPPSSPYVVAVGGTSLFLDGDGEYLSESGWKGSDGGISQYENQPAFQKGVVTQSRSSRCTPDISFVADPNTGVMVYDTYGGRGFYGIGGTSASCPIMAGLTAILDQGRSYLFGRNSYRSPRFLNALYHLPQSDLQDIVTGNNGFAAGPGYDLVTGLGTPIVDRFVSAMTGAPVYNPLTGDLLVTGGGQGSNDTIAFTRVNNQLVITISADQPLPGSDIPASQTFTFNSDQYSSITIAAGDGTTTITVDDSDDASDRTVMLSGDSLTGLSLGPIRFATGTYSSLTITGGTGNNRYTVTGTPAGQGTTLNTGTGMDSISIQGTGSPVTVNSAAGSGADTIVVGNASNTLSDITAAVVVNAAPTDSLIVNDQGFADGRTFTVTATAIDWGGSTITYSGLGSVTLNGGTGGNTFDLLATATATVTIVGGSSSDILAGSNAGNRFTLVGSDAGTLGGDAYGSPVLFSQVSNLMAGSGGDTFQFADGASLTGNIVASGNDTLDYSAYSASVVVDLRTGFATGVGGSVSGIATVFGGSGTPAASGVFNLLIGGGGNVLHGGFGRRNVLVAGSSASTLSSGDGEDLLIAGSTAYDTEADLSTWQQITAYWAGTDDYATRVGILTSGTGVPLLDASVVIGNSGSNVMNGNGALALLFTNGLDAIAGFDPDSQQITILP